MTSVPPYSQGFDLEPMQQGLPLAYGLNFVQEHGGCNSELRAMQTATGVLRYVCAPHLPREQG